MITLYSGLPGSGKSYRMVYDLIKMSKDYYVIHNIDGLKPGVIDNGIHFIKYCEEEGLKVIDFFSKEEQVKFSDAVLEKYGLNCLVIIDEAQEWFDKEKKNLKMWLSYHRHLNQTIWLVAHRMTNIHSSYRGYIQEENRAKYSSVICVPGYFVYNRLLGGEAVGYTFTKKKKEVFEAYKSQVQAGFKKQRPSMLIPVVLALCISGIAYFLFMPGRVIGKSNSKLAIEKNNPESNFQRSENINKKFRLIGIMGDSVIVQDLETMKNLSINEMDNHYAVIEKGNNTVKLYDKLTRKFIDVDNVEQAAKPILEAVRPAPGNKSK